MLSSYYPRPGIVERTGGSYDLAGVWRPATYGPYTFRFNNRAYNRGLHASYYNFEDDYYGSYCDLLEYEGALRLNRHLSEQERLRRWRMRLAFEELEEAERLRRYRSMAHTDRIMLGLTDNSWWGERYGSHPYDHRPDWRHRFGNKIRRWDSSYLPLSSSLMNRYAPVWSGSSSLSYPNGHLDSGFLRATNDVHVDRLIDSDRRLENDIRRNELARAERDLVHQDRYLQNRIEDNLLHNQERAMEDRMMNDMIYDQQRSLEREALYDQERCLESQRYADNMLYDQERRLEDSFEDDAIYRAERRLDDDERYLERAEILDSGLRSRALSDYGSYPDVSLGLEDELVRDVVEDEYLDRRDLGEDLLY